MVEMNKTNGLTLLELVVALAISVLLVGATAGVLNSMARKKEVFADNLTVQGWPQELSARFRTDLLHATQLRVRPDGLSLTGPCGYDLRTGEFQQKSAIVDWIIVRQGGQSVLVRRQRTDESVITPGTSSVEFFGVGIESISIGLFTGEEQAGGTSAPLTTITPREWTPVAPALHWIVRGPNNIILLDEVLYR